MLSGSLGGDCPLAERVDQDVVVDVGAKEATVEALDAVGGVGPLENVSVELLEDGQDEVDVARASDSPRRRRVLSRPLGLRRD